MELLAKRCNSRNTRKISKSNKEERLINSKSVWTSLTTKELNIP